MTERQKGWHDGVLAALDVLIDYHGVSDTPEYRTVRGACTDDASLRAACKRVGDDALERHGFSVSGGRDAE